MIQNLNIAIASGKGGTGKTLLSVNMAMMLSKMEIPTQLIDCDVEAPNDRLFLGNDRIITEPVYVPTPVVDLKKCNLCGKCVRTCEFNAMAKVRDKMLIFPELCHSCGACKVVCPVKAIEEISHQVGTLYSWQHKMIECHEGELGIGENASVAILNKLHKKISPHKVSILDAAPGASCPVVSVIHQADFVVLVTEPTPFGLHDLKIAVELCRTMKKSYGVVINRCDIGDQSTVEYCKTQGIQILSKIQHSRNIAECYSRGEVIIHKFPLYQSIFKHIIENIFNCYEQEQLKKQIS